MLNILEQIYMGTASPASGGGVTPTGTISITENGTYHVANYASADVNVASGGGGKYGANASTLLGDVDANGVLQQPTEQSDLVFTGVTDVVGYVLNGKFAKTNVKSVSFPNLTTISGNYGCQNAFNDDTALTSVSFPNLTTISGGSGCRYMFQSCTALTSVSLPNLTTISGNYGCYGMLAYCTALTSVSFPNLTTISNTSTACNYMFDGCTALTDVYFPALTTSSFGSIYNAQFSGMMIRTGSEVKHTLHFPSNLESTIQGLSGYPNFGGTSDYIVLAFDLPATS